MLSHFSGRFGDVTAILPSGPLNWDQFAGFEHDVTTSTITITGMISDPISDLCIIKKEF
jgi:hypothetical protein